MDAANLEVTGEFTVACQEEYLNADGNPDLDKIQLICYDSIGNTYRVLGESVGNAFKDGAALKK